MLTVDTHELSALARDLRKSNPELLKKLQKALKEGGLTVAIEARLISGYSSSRIPGSIRVVSKGLTTLVRAGGAGAPHARPFEHEGVPGTFRHPVFGHRDQPWVPQEAHPFLAPALEKEAGNVERGALAAVSAVFAEIGFR